MSAAELGKLVILDVGEDPHFTSENRVSKTLLEILEIYWNNFPSWISWKSTRN